MEFSHVSVLYDESLTLLSIKPDGIYVDGTLGGGGHSFGICSRLTTGRLIGIDRDTDAIEAAKIRLQPFMDKVTLVHSNYTEVESVLDSLNISGIDGAILDLGVSSYQLDNPKRGFSYMQDAPLDMRMDKDSTLTAYNIVNSYSQKSITALIRDYGEDRWASRIAEFIVKAREKKPIETTYELVDIIKAAIPQAARRDGPHPAKRTFQAIRIEVNDELGGLKKALKAFFNCLKPGGVLSVITFHSLEDRVVKETFAGLARGCECPKILPVCVCNKVEEGKLITKKAIKPSETEEQNNPRARSASLRGIIKL